MGHDHAHASGRAADRSRLKLVLAITVSVMVIELIGAWIAGSLALLADAGHMAADAAAIVLALGASYVATRQAGPRSTYGWPRSWPPCSTPWFCWRSAATWRTPASPGSPTRSPCGPPR